MNLLDDKIWKEFIRWLDTRYYDPDSGEWNRNVSRDDYTHSRYDFGNSYNLCMAIMGVLQRAGHRVTVIGAEANVMDQYRSNSIGLDWLLVDDRYIIDPWGFSYEAQRRIVYDINDPADQDIISALFPPRQFWEPGRPSDELIEIGVRVFDDFMMPRRAVDNLLGDETEP